MVKLRLHRQGRTKKPHYLIVATSSRRKRDGMYIEKIGTYDPLMKTDNSHEKFTLNLEKYDLWLSKGAQPTEKVSRAAFLKRKLI